MTRDEQIIALRDEIMLRLNETCRFLNRTANDIERYASSPATLCNAVRVVQQMQYTINDMICGYHGTDICGNHLHDSGLESVYANFVRLNRRAEA